MLSLSLAIFTGCVAILTGIALRCDWTARTRSRIAFLSGFVALFGGVTVWDYQERKDNWRISDQQRKLLQDALGQQTKKFPVTYFPINSEPLAQRYAYDLLSVFAGSGWPHMLVTPNWVVPTQAHGLMIATCPSPPDSLKESIAEQKETLRILFSKASVPVSSVPSTEEFLQDLILQTGFPKCAIGLVLGQPPSPCERINLSAPWVPNLWCAISK